MVGTSFPLPLFHRLLSHWKLLEVHFSKLSGEIQFRHSPTYSVSDLTRKFSTCLPQLTTIGLLPAPGRQIRILSPLLSHRQKKNSQGSAKNHITVFRGFCYRTDSPSRQLLLLREPDNVESCRKNRLLSYISSSATRNHPTGAGPLPWPLRNPGTACIWSKSYREEGVEGNRVKLL